MSENQKLLKTSEVAAILGIARSTLCSWRTNEKNIGPDYVEISSKIIRYPEKAVFEFINKNTVTVKKEK